MHIIFVHTPMPTLEVEEREEFWRNFDIRYYAMHPNIRPMKQFLWELPHWVTWLGGVLEHDGFSSLEALDLYTQTATPDGVDELKAINILANHPGDFYLFSPLTPNLHCALRIAEIVKNLYPRSLTVFGGVVATPLNKEIAANPNVDYVVSGRGEYALPELLKALINNDVNDVGNLTYKTKDKQVVTNKHIYPDMPLDQLPFPKIDIFPHSTGEDIRYIRQVYALGCPYKCAFCSAPGRGQRLSYFPIDRVISEIKAYKAHYGDHHHIYFGDLTFTANIGPSLEFCSALEREGNIYYDCQTRVSCLQDPRLPKALYDSGCRWLEMGIETANHETMNLFKHTDFDLVEDTLKRFRDNGIATCPSMLVGLPNESIDDMQRTVDWICSSIESGLLYASYFFNLVPYPGTMMFEEPETYGIKLHHREFSLYREDLLPVYDTSHATAEQIYKVFLDGVSAIGKAMASKPHFGEVKQESRSEKYGDFWRTAHP